MTADRAKAKCHHLGRNTPTTPRGHPPGTPSARGDATKDHDVALPPRGAAVRAAGSTRSPALALQHLRDHHPPTIQDCPGVSARCACPDQPRTRPCSPQCDAGRAVGVSTASGGGKSEGKRGRSEAITQRIATAFPQVNGGVAGTGFEPV